jgi:hypothetical protein
MFEVSTSTSAVFQLWRSDSRSSRRVQPLVTDIHNLYIQSASMSRRIAAQHGAIAYDEASTKHSLWSRPAYWTDLEG